MCENIKIYVLFTYIRYIVHKLIQIPQLNPSLGVIEPQAHFPKR